MAQHDGSSINARDKRLTSTEFRRAPSQFYKSDQVEKPLEMNTMKEIITPSSCVVNEHKR